MINWLKELIQDTKKEPKLLINFIALFVAVVCVMFIFVVINKPNINIFIIPILFFIIMMALIHSSKLYDKYEKIER